MKNISSPFDKMYKSFALFGNANKKSSDKIIQMSAGVNWQKMNPTIEKLLHWEISSSISYRNYGRSVGSKIITDIIETVEAELGGINTKPSSVICQGTCEGSYLVFQHLKKTNYLKDNDSCLMIGHGFPFYSKLAEEFNLKYVEVLKENHEKGGFLPSVSKIESFIKKCQPKLVFLIAPNNPFGEMYSLNDLKLINKLCKKYQTKILIDRVCLMAWDTTENINLAFLETVNNGHAFIVDSFSKSESLAGLRTGFLLTNQKIANAILKIIQYRQLNPIVFSSPTLAFSVVASLCIQKGNEKLKMYKNILKRHGDLILSEYPSKGGKELSLEYPFTLFVEYIDNAQKSKAALDRKFNILKEMLLPYALKPLVLDGGFNVALLMDSMKLDKEESDQQLLVSKFQTAVLTESCFRVSANKSKNYFIRVGLSIPEDEFIKGLNSLKTFFLK